MIHTKLFMDMRKFFKRFSLLEFDRSFSKGIGSQLVWLTAIMLVVYVVLALVSYVGQMYMAGESEQNRFIDILLVLIDPGSGSEAMSNPLVIICAILGLVIFSGMLISVISNVLERRVERFTKGETDYRVSNHVVILGFNKSVPSLLTEIHGKFPDAYILMMCNQNIEELRDWIHANVTKEIEDALILMNGVRNAQDDLERLRLNCHVREVYVLGEPDEPAHDETSLETVGLIAKFHPGENLRCYVQIDSHSVFSMLQREWPDGIKEKIKAVTNEEPDKATDKQSDQKNNKEEEVDLLKFIPFNFCEIWAQKAVATIPNPDFRPLDGDGITADIDRRVHLVVVGMNELSMTLALHAAHVLHFPNFKDGQPETGSTITFVDAGAGVKGEAFRSRFRNLFSLSRWRSVDDSKLDESDAGWLDPLDEMEDCALKKHMGRLNFMDIQWEFIEAQPSSEAVMDYMDSIAGDGRSVLTVVLCEEQSEENISLCMSLPEKVRLQANEIFVRANESGKAVDTLRKVYGFGKVRAFGMVNECYKENLMSEKYGKLINACYGDWSSGEKKEIDIEDDVAVSNHWDKTKIIDRWSSIYSGNMLFYRLRSLGLKTEAGHELKEKDVNAAVEKYKEKLAMLEHYRWITEKLILGFRPLSSEDELYLWMHGGKKRMKQQFVHGDIRGFNELSEGDKKKDEDVTSKLFLLYTLAKDDIKG